MDNDDDDPAYQCQCSEGYIGGDCAQRECPYGLAWFYYPTEDEVKPQATPCAVFKFHTFHTQSILKTQQQIHSNC